MANNGIRQVGEARINVFADRQRPEPFHLEVNQLGVILSIYYIDNVFREMLHMSWYMSSTTPVGQGGCVGTCLQNIVGQGGCGRAQCSDKQS